MKISNSITIAVNDVKPGRGNHSHPGNKYYVQLIDENKKVFVLAGSKLEKKSIVDQIYTKIRQLDPPGRFLKKKADGTWGVKDKDEALGKVWSALRENNVMMIENLKKRGEWIKGSDGRKTYKQPQRSKAKQGDDSKIGLLIEASMLQRKS